MSTLSFRYPIPDGIEVAPSALDGLIGSTASVDIFGALTTGRITDARLYEDEVLPGPALWITLELEDRE